MHTDHTDRRRKCQKLSWLASTKVSTEFYTLSHLLSTPGNVSSTVPIVMPLGLADASQPVQPFGAEAGCPGNLGTTYSTESLSACPVAFTF